MTVGLASLSSRKEGTWLGDSNKCPLGFTPNTTEVKLPPQATEKKQKGMLGKMDLKRESS